MVMRAAVVGSAAGLLGAAFQILVSEIAEFRLSWEMATRFSPDAAWIYPILAGMLLVVISLFLTRRFAPEAAGSGIQEIEGALEGVRPVRWRRVIPVKFFAGLASTGSGLVLGREGPTVQMGGSLGKMFSELFRVNEEEAHVLIAAGAGAGLSAAFNAPLAGMLFVIEEMRPQFRYNFLSVHAVMIATAMATVVVRALMGQAADFSVADPGPPPLLSLWLFVVLGAFFGGLGVLFNQLVFIVLDFYSRLPRFFFVTTGVFIGLFIGVMAWLDPDATGSGDQVVMRILDHGYPTRALLVLLIVRLGTTVLSFGSGVPGGIFSPMLAIGTLFGGFFGQIMQMLLPTLVPNWQLFSIAGMGALFSATVGAPITGIVLTMELTETYSLTLAMMLTCTSAAIVGRALGGQPIYSVLLERTLRRAQKT
jgi:CIC family chloride channel protein